MAAPQERPRAGFRLPLRGGPVVPLVGVCVGVVALTAAVTLGGEDSSSNTGKTDADVLTTSAVMDPANLPAANTCVLKVGGVARSMALPAARTLTQVAAVGSQVKAPEEMVARVLDLASAKPGPGVSVTDTLDLFTREDTAAPSPAAMADLRALTEPGGLICVFGSPAVPAEAKGKSGLTPRADAMRQGIVDAFGRLTMSGYGSKAAKGSPEAAGRALNVAIPDTLSPGAGWVLASWLTARGADYKLDTIAYSERTWTPAAGWQPTTPGQATATAARPGRVYVSVAAGTSTKAKDTAKADTKKARKKR